ncbi:MAG TPA: hypothetical protein VKY85_19580 [Candidatus Angelobacter sp.]|nr:hypothetical protein [Candidatus Angelobacter sp.]
MATKDVKRSIPAAQPRRRYNPQLKIRAYETLYRLNRGFNITAFHFERLEELDILDADDLRALRAYHSTCEEVRALTNADLMLLLESQEQQDAVRFQNQRLNWENRIRQPLKLPKPKNKTPSARKP